MNICIIICGLPKNLNIVLDNFIDKFKDQNLSFYICTNNQIKIIPENKNIKKILIVNDIYDDKFRNCLNYLNKVCNALKIIDKNYDLYFIVRSDLILFEINFDHIKDESLYFSSNHMNQFSNYTDQRINDNIIISKSIDNLKILNNLYLYCQRELNFLDICIYKFLNKNQVNYSLINISYKIMLYTCENIVAICGDSGSGKSTLANYLIQVLNKDNNLLLETDRYHKWERGNLNYKEFSHLHPEANNLEKLNEDVYNLKLGNEIYQVDYDHSTGKFTNKEKIESKKSIIISGLHTLYSKDIHKITNLKIYLDTDIKLITDWKIKRDVNERGYSAEKVLEQIERRRDDFEEFIKIQKDNADMVIKFYENTKCKLSITNIDMISKILPYVTRNNFKFLFDKDILILEIDNTLEIKGKKINIEFTNKIYMYICDVILEIIKN